MKGSMTCTGSILSETRLFWGKWYCAKGEMWKYFHGFLCPSCIYQVYFLRKSTDFHGMRTECQSKLLSFIYYCIIYFNHSSITCNQIVLLAAYYLPNTLLPDRLLRNYHSPIALSPWLFLPWLIFLPDYLLPNLVIFPTHLVHILLLFNLLPDCLIALPFLFGFFLALPNR